MVAAINIGARKVGPGQPCFIVAEAGVNHNGNLDLAIRMIDVAVEAGVDAIKFQAFSADGLVTRTAPKAGYQKETTDAGESQYEMLKRLEVTEDGHRRLTSYCKEKGILYMCTPFDEESADFLIRLGVAVLKIPSGEITNLPLLARVARSGKPLIVSTGMSNLKEVETAVRTMRESGNRELVLLHCTSNYPADPATANLRAMRTMEESLGVPVGYSDHTPGIEVALAAVTLGASVIEKHFTLSRFLPGPDHQASVEPDELKRLATSIRVVEAALGHGQKEPVATEADTAAVARKSLVAACDVPAGAMLTEAMIAIKRPGTGLAPEIRPQVIGRVTRVPIASGTVISFDMLA